MTASNVFAQFATMSSMSTIKFTGAEIDDFISEWFETDEKRSEFWGMASKDTDRMQKLATLYRVAKYEKYLTSYGIFLGFLSTYALYNDVEEYIDAAMSHQADCQEEFMIAVVEANDSYGCIAFFETYRKHKPSADQYEKWEELFDYFGNTDIIEAYIEECGFDAIDDMEGNFLGSYHNKFEYEVAAIYSCLGGMMDDMHIRDYVHLFKMDEVIYEFESAHTTIQIGGTYYVFCM